MFTTYSKMNHTQKSCGQTSNMFFDNVLNCC